MVIAAVEIMTLQSPSTERIGKISSRHLKLLWQCIDDLFDL